MSRPRVLIADDHKMFAQGLASLLEDEFELVGSVADGETLLKEAERLKPDVVLVDISMPILNGLDAVRRLSAHSHGRAPKVIFLTMHADGRLLAEAFRCGAAGYVLKQSAGEDVIFAIHEVMAGGRYVSPLMAQESGATLKERQRTGLTRRQREVLQLLSEGCTMKQIAGRLGISTRTAETYKYDMMSDLGVETTAELIQYAVKLGLTKT